MTIKKDRVRTRATLASKIAGKKSRARTFRRDLRGRFSFADAKVTGSSSAQVAEARKVLRKNPPSTFKRKIRTASIVQKGRKLKTRRV